MSTRGYTPAILADVGLFPVNVGLAIACLYLLADVKPGQQPPRERAMLSLFTVLLGGLALAAILTDGYSFVNYVHLVTSNCGHTSSNLRGLFRDQMLPETLPIVLWCVEGFMLWRACVHLRNFNQFLLGLFSASLVGLSIWSGSVVLFSRFSFTGSFEETYHTITISTAIINLIITGVIAARLMCLDLPTSQIFLESGAPLTLNAVLAALFYPIKGWMSFAVIIMPQIAILSALLVVYQISQKDEGVIRLDERSLAPSES
jgi:hypothetical protein